jgi:hypothetical protein
VTHGILGWPAALPDLIGDILDGYLTQKALHGQGAEEAGSGAPAIELD